MRNLFKSKKFNSFLLTMIMIISLFLFSACDGNKIGERSILKIIYKPYSTSRPALLSKTYGEIIEDNLVDMSSDVLSYLVGYYGTGEVEVKKDADSTQNISPDVSSVDYKSLLAISSSLSESDKASYVSDFSKLTKVYFSSGNKILALTNNPDLSMNNIVTYDINNSKYVAKTNLKKISGTGGNFSSNADLTNYSVYKHENSGKISYIFIGGYVGSNANSFSSDLNAKLYISEFYKTSFNNIQKSLSSEITLNNNNLADLPFVSWEYSLTESEAKSCSSAEEYLTKYVEKFNLNLAVEISKTILTRYEGWALTEELSSLYSTASSTSASKSSKENFIKECCKYIDHLGLLEEEKTLLSNFVVKTVIGEAISNSNPKYSENCANILGNISNIHTVNPILEYKTFIGSSIDEVEVDGYLQSLVIMTEKEFTFDSVLIELTNKVNKEETVYYKNTIRYCNDGVIKDYPIKDIDFSTTVNIDCPKDNADESKTIKMKISSCKDNIPSTLIGEENSIKKNIASYFTSTKYSSNDTVKEGCAWCFNDTSASYVEIVFAVDDILNQNEVDIFTMTF